MIVDAAFLDDLLTKARKLGADEVDLLHVESSNISAACRNQKVETMERADSSGLGIRILRRSGAGYRQAIVSTSDLSLEAINSTLKLAVEMSEAVPTDEFAGLAESSAISAVSEEEINSLELCDSTEPSADSLMEMAMRAENAGLSIGGVTNTEGGEASFSRSKVYICASNGFRGGYNTSGFSISASMLAGSGTGMERDYDFTSARYFHDLKTPEEIGKSAGERAVKRLNSVKMKTGEYPVVFDPRVARGLLGSFISAISGAAIARKTSFLQEKMGESVFPSGVRIIDNPLIKRGLASKPFDKEGIRTQKLSLVQNGILQSWILDLRSARQLNLSSTGHASRGLSSPPSPSPSNVYMENGSATPEQLIAGIKDGLYLTNTFGMGINLITGDYSQGASGFRIENGAITTPVSEITIAGNLADMFASITPANDLVLERAINAPTILIDKMTIAGD
jgi:PmbA protein